MAEILTKILLDGTTDLDGNVYPRFDTMDGLQPQGTYAIDGPNAVIRLSTGEICTLPKESIVNETIGDSFIELIRMMN